MQFWGARSWAKMETRQPFRPSRWRHVACLLPLALDHVVLSSQPNARINVWTIFFESMNSGIKVEIVKYVLQLKNTILIDLNIWFLIRRWRSHPNAMHYKSCAFSPWIQRISFPSSLPLHSLSWEYVPSSPPVYHHRRSTDKHVAATTVDPSSTIDSPLPHEFRRRCQIHPRVPPSSMPDLASPVESIAPNTIFPGKKYLSDLEVLGLNFLHPHLQVLGLIFLVRYEGSRFESFASSWFEVFQSDSKVLGLKIFNPLWKFSFWIFCNTIYIFFLSWTCGGSNAGGGLRSPATGRRSGGRKRED